MPMPQKLKRFLFSSPVSEPGPGLLGQGKGHVIFCFQLPCLSLLAFSPEFEPRDTFRLAGKEQVGDQRHEFQLALFHVCRIVEETQ